jgi:hypothetical protein
MSLERKALRADLVAAVQDAASGIFGLAGRPVLSAWTQDVDAKALPVIGVSVPAESRRDLAQDTVEQDFRAIVVVKIAHPGGDASDTEDALDDIAEGLAGPIEADLLANGRDVALISSAIEVSGACSPRIGTLTLTFAAQTTRGRTSP